MFNLNSQRSHSAANHPLEEHPRRIVRQLLDEPSVPLPVWAEQPLMVRSVEMLDRRAPTIVEAARRANLNIDYLGIGPLFPETRLYEGLETDWVLAPADGREETVIPRRQQRDLRRIRSALNDQFQLIYVAHEVEKARTEGVPAVPANGHKVIEPSTAVDLVGPVPPPASTVELGDRLAVRSGQLLNAMRRAVPLVGAAALGVVAAPVVLVGAAIASLATLDPIVLGAIPALSSYPGDPAAWFVLARWDW
jgi:hypothetical protein